MSPRERLDVVMVKRGLVSSRTEAQLAIDQGSVSVGGRPMSKAASLVDAAESVKVAAAPRRFVSRGGDKLDAALARASIDVAGRRCLDVGASTGGFTDRLLQGNAASVVALDVGYGQLDWRLRTNAAVTVLERTNIRTTEAASVGGPFDLVVADVSFISLRTVMPALSSHVGEHGDFVFLVKPQFEVGPDGVGKGGVVRDPLLWREAVADVCASALAHSLSVSNVMASPLAGPAGNVEFLIWGSRLPSRPLPAEALEDAIRDGLALKGVS